MRSAKQAAFYHAGLARDGSANINQRLSQQQRQAQDGQTGVWRQNADLRDQVQRHSRGVRHMRPSQPQLQSRRLGSEARLGDIIVSIMRRIDNLEASVSQLRGAISTQTSDCTRAVESLQSTVHSEIESMKQEIFCIGRNNESARMRPSSMMTTSDVGEFSYHNEVWSDAEPTDGEGYDYESQTEHDDFACITDCEGYDYEENHSDRASPTPSEKAELAMFPPNTAESGAKAGHMESDANVRGTLIASADVLQIEGVNGSGSAILPDFEKKDPGSAPKVGSSAGVVTLDISRSATRSADV